LQADDAQVRELVPFLDGTPEAGDDALRLIAQQQRMIEWLQDCFDCVCAALDTACVRLALHDDEEGIGHVRARMDEYGRSELIERSPSRG